MQPDECDDYAEFFDGYEDPNRSAVYCLMGSQPQDGVRLDRATLHFLAEYLEAVGLDEMDRLNQRDPFTLLSDVASTCRTWADEEAA